MGPLSTALLNRATQAHAGLGCRSLHGSERIEGRPRPAPGLTSREATDLTIRISINKYPKGGLSTRQPWKLDKPRHIEGAASMPPTLESPRVSSPGCDASRPCWRALNMPEGAARGRGRWGSPRGWLGRPAATRSSRRVTSRLRRRKDPPTEFFERWVGANSRSRASSPFVMRS
jgi:hypothetical protein